VKAKAWAQEAVRGEGLTYPHRLEVHLSVTIVVEQFPENQLRVFCTLKG
jgi:hypothetical protein